MNWWLVCILLYVIVGIRIARGTTFTPPEPWDKLKAFFIWPAIVGITIVRLFEMLTHRRSGIITILGKDHYYNKKDI